MERPRIWAIAIFISVVTFFLSAIFLMSCSAPDDNSYSFKSNGERIYFTSQSSSGDSIVYEGVVGMMNRRLACVTCHGPDGKGGTVRIMMTQLEVPDITWSNLSKEFNEKEVKQLITQGVEPDGELLDIEMPRWRMSDRDLNDLVEFLKTLK